MWEGVRKGTREDRESWWGRGAWRETAETQTERKSKRGVVGETEKGARRADSRKEGRLEGGRGEEGRRADTARKSGGEEGKGGASKGKEVMWGITQKQGAGTER